jgi:hypothetical protein
MNEKKREPMIIPVRYLTRSELDVVARREWNRVDRAMAKPCVRLSPWHPGRCVLYRSLDGYDHMAANRFTHSVAELDRAAHIANRAIARAMTC